MRALLDINVLIALLDSQHIHHQLAHTWLAANAQSGWASCPLTQNGFVRIMSQPSYPNPVTPADAAARLGEACNTSWHVFWPDALSLLGNSIVDFSQILGSRQITDAYLLALAVHHDGRFVTLDRKVTLAAVPGALEQHLEVIQ